MIIALLLAVVAATSDSTSSWHTDFLGPTTTLPDGHEVNAAAHYWSDIVGVPFTRDVEVVVPPTPLDFDLDGRPDTTFEGRWSLPGGILGNPKQVGLVATPDDPGGTVGEYSISTGFLGIREEKDAKTGRGTGRFGFTCWVCHGSADDQGKIVLGKPNVNIHLGLILASSDALNPQHVVRWSRDDAPIAPKELRKREGLDESFKLDADGDGRVTVAEWRAAMKLPTTDETRAVVLLAGPGRLDQSVDHRMDGTIPLANLQLYTMEKVGSKEFLRKAKLPKRAVFNPVSLPHTLAGLGVSHYAWTGKDSAMRHDAVKLITDQMKITPNELADLVRFPRVGDVDFESLSRALTLDFRNVGTAGREADDVKGNWWSHDVLTKPTKEILTKDAARLGAVPLRELLTRERPQRASSDSQVAEGRGIFAEKIVGEVINQRVLLGREALATADTQGIGVIAPLDRSKPIDAKVPVRCATCHNYSPLASKVPIATPLDAFRRCDVCHMDHPRPDDKTKFVALSEYAKLKNVENTEGCLRCHETHRDFGSQAYSNSWLLPLDANGNGFTHRDEEADGAAGGIGTDGEVNIDTLFVVQLQPVHRRPQHMYLVSDNARAVPREAKFSTQGYGWVRVAPLAYVADTAPYLHNGSVPTLEALLAKPEDRPARFSVGLPEQKFTFDTSLPGNRNGGHAFGNDLTAEEKAVLIRFLKSME